MPKKQKIRITIEGDTISWARGGEGMSVGEFAEKFPCSAVAYLQETMGVEAMGQALISEILRVNGSLQDWARNTHCANVDLGIIQQI